MNKARNRKVLIAGESSVKTTFHQKGVDSFILTTYSEAVGWLRAALEAGGWDVDFLPNHVAGTKFPGTADELKNYRCVILSDIGANTLLLHPQTFAASERTPNRLAAIRDYVVDGGGFIMVGGYLTFQGIDAKARYAGTPVEDVLPVTLSVNDDRMEVPEGVVPQVVAKKHPIVQGLEQLWPALLGYNVVTPRKGAHVIATVREDPLLAVHQFKGGRTVAFTSDCGPHWAPPAFCEWNGYKTLWQRMVGWAAQE
jgi:uncharacterized membrane protein